MITGGALILCAVMFIGASNGSNGKYQAWSSDNHRAMLLNTTTGQAYVGEGGNGSMKWREITVKPKFLFKGRDAY